MITSKPISGASLLRAKGKGKKSKKVLLSL
jgi:hypothetical protein